MKVMLVDDSSTMRKIIKTSISGLDYEIVEAENGQDALDKLPGAGIELFIVDVNMPVMNGLEFGRKLRGQTGYESTPVIYVTTEIDSDLEEAKNDIGVKGWLKKPFKKEELVALINS